MASIIKEKSMGRPENGRHSSTAGRSGRGLPVFYADVWLKLQTSPVRIVILKSVSISFLVIFSALFLIYCRTGSHTLHEDPSQETVVQKELSESAGLPVQTPEKPSVPDLGPLNRVMSLGEAPDTLRGVFWKERDFKGEYYLSFDDGPNREIMPGNSQSVCESILDSLTLYDHRAVFFINGKNLEYGDEQEKLELRSLLLRIIEEGHLLGNHSYSHHNLAKGIYLDGMHDTMDVENELTMTQEALDEILGFPYPLLLVRPPYAEPGRSDVLDEIISRNGQFLISLQFDSYDYAYREDGLWNSSTIAARILSLMEENRDGGVLLLHELDSTARMLPGLLKDFNNHQMSVGSLEDHLIRKYGRNS